MDDVSGLPLHKIAANPDHAVEHYKYLLGQIRQMYLLADKAQLEASLAKPDSLTETEKLLWLAITRQARPSS
jgi:voltage-gated potassium channel